MADQILQDIKDRLNIADVIGGYIQLRKAGTNFKALCPFHNERSPSLQISPQKQIWHCFGCGEGGDVFGFVMKYENVEFREALKILAQKAGVQLPEYRPGSEHKKDERELLLRINDFAARFYHEILTKDKRGEAALAYLEKRGLTAGTIRSWRIGFAPDDFHALENALAKKGVSGNDLVLAGVSSKNEQGKMYDRFRGRITFPIYNFYGEVVGFSARILRDDGKSAKYVNSPETLVYSKSRVLFGLHAAKQSIRKKNEAVIVEGQMDCIAAHQAGFENVVASSGTALTAEQLVLLGRLTKNLKFCFDADSAGQAASARAGELALQQGFRLKTIVLQNVKDPDELIRKNPGLWEKAVSEAQWFLDRQMDLALQKFPQDPIEQKHMLTASVLPLLNHIPDPLEQDHYIKRMAEMFDISERSIREGMRVAGRGASPKPSVADPSPGVRTTNLLEKEVMGGMLLLPDFFSHVRGEVKAEDFTDPELRVLAEAMIKNGQAPSGEADGTVAKEAAFMVELRLEELGDDKDQLLKQLDRSFALLRLTGIKRQQKVMNERIKQAESRAERELLRELNQEFAGLAAERLKFESRL